MPQTSSLMPVESITEKIFFIRGQKVMLSTHLAAIYGISHGARNQAVKRNIERFPRDFMFILDDEEITHLKSQFVISKKLGRGGARHAPYAFTEQGVAMLSSVLNSSHAVQMNIAIMRAFVRLRQVLQSHDVLAQQLRDLELRVGDHDEKIRAIFDAIRQLIAAPEPQPKKIGFEVRERRFRYVATGRN